MLEGKYDSPQRLKDTAGAFLIGVIAVVLLLVIAAIFVRLI